jgi:hypothetical protein
MDGMVVGCWLSDDGGGKVSAIVLVVQVPAHFPQVTDGEPQDFQAPGRRYWRKINLHSQVNRVCRVVTNRWCSFMGSVTEPCSPTSSQRTPAGVCSLTLICSGKVSANSSHLFSCRALSAGTTGVSEF